jgi:hypothetical protein
VRRWVSKGGIGNIRRQRQEHSPLMGRLAVEVYGHLRTGPAVGKGLSNRLERVQHRERSGHLVAPYGLAAIPADPESFDDL